MADSAVVSDRRQAVGYLWATLSLMIFSGWFGVDAFALAPITLRLEARLPASDWRGAALIRTWSAILFLPVYAVCGLSRLASVSPSDLVLQVVYQGVVTRCLAAKRQSVRSAFPKHPT